VQRICQATSLFRYLALTNVYIPVMCRVRKEDAYGQLLEGRLSGIQKTELLQSLTQRAHLYRPAHVPRGVTRQPSIDITRPDNNKYEASK
jgi:hypothetical protein